MSPILVTGTIIVNLALIFYTVGIVAEQRSRRVSRTVVSFLTAGVVFDLVAGFGAADAISQTSRTDLGTSAARRHLVSGWSEDQWLQSRQVKYVRGMGTVSTLRFVVLEPQNLSLRLHGRLIDAPAESAVAVDVRVNGNPVGVWDVRTPSIRGYRGR